MGFQNEEADKVLLISLSASVFDALEMLLVLLFCVLKAVVKVSRLRDKTYIIFSFVK